MHRWANSVITELEVQCVLHQRQSGSQTTTHNSKKTPKKEEENEEGQIAPIHTTDCQGGPGHSVQLVEQAGGEQGREESPQKTEEGWVSIACKIIPSSPLSQETRSRPCVLSTGAWKPISNQLWKRTFSPIPLLSKPQMDSASRGMHPDGQKWGRGHQPS